MSKHGRHDYFKKGTIVWYWNREECKWLRGKVISINKYWGPFMHPRGLWVKNRHTGKRYFVPMEDEAFPASEPKPTMTMEQLQKKNDVLYNARWGRGGKQRVRFIERMIGHL